MFFGLISFLLRYTIRSLSFPEFTSFLIQLAFLIAASYAIAYYWESKREGYFRRGLLTSLIFGPLSGAIIGFSFDRVDLLGSRARGSTVLNDLMIAAVKQKPVIIQNLVAGGAKVMKKTPTKRTALMIAAESNKYPQVCDILIRAGINVNDRDKNGMTALMYATKNNDNEEVCEMLLKHGSNVNMQDNNGTTALMHAAYINPNPEIVSLLLKAGANPKLADKEGKTVFNYAYMLPNRVFLDSDVFNKLRRVTIITPSP